MGLLITACTNRKRLPAPAALRASSLPDGGIDAVAVDWGKRLRASAERVPAGSLYAGRGFAEARRASAALGGEMVIVSAGLGAVSSDRLVPAYALSVVAGSPDDVLRKLGPRASAQAWWEMLQAQSPFHDDLRDQAAAASGAILVALSEAYLDMVAPDLATLEAGALRRLRILTRAPFGRIAPHLQPHVMPYDDRLDGPDSSARGTRGDFASRAARHFAETVLQRLPDAGVEEHRAEVVGCLADWRHPPRHARRRLTDEELLALLRQRWAEAGGQSSRLLRVLRDDLNVACEQGRFAGLVNRLRSERALAA